MKEKKKKLPLKFPTKNFTIFRQLDFTEEYFDSSIQENNMLINLRNKFLSINKVKESEFLIF